MSRTHSVDLGWFLNESIWTKQFHSICARDRTNFRYIDRTVYSLHFSGKSWPQSFLFCSLSANLSRDIWFYKTQTLRVQKPTAGTRWVLNRRIKKCSAWRNPLPREGCSSVWNWKLLRLRLLSALSGTRRRRTWCLLAGSLSKQKIREDNSFKNKKKYRSPVARLRKTALFATTVLQERTIMETEMVNKKSDVKFIFGSLATSTAEGDLRLEDQNIESFKNWWTKRCRKDESNTSNGIIARVFDCEFNVNSGFISEQLPAKIVHYVSSTVTDFIRSASRGLTGTASSSTRWKSWRWTASCARTTTCIARTPRCLATTHHASDQVTGYPSVQVLKSTQKHRKPNGYRDRKVESGQIVVPSTTILVHGTLTQKGRKHSIHMNAVHQHDVQADRVILCTLFAIRKYLELATGKPARTCMARTSFFQGPRNNKLSVWITACFGNHLFCRQACFNGTSKE